MAYHKLTFWNVLWYLMHWKLKYIFMVSTFISMKINSFCISWRTLVFISTHNHKQWVFSSLLFNSFRVRVSVFSVIFSLVPTSVKFSNYILCWSICSVTYSSFWSKTSVFLKNYIYVGYYLKYLLLLHTQTAPSWFRPDCVRC